MEEIFDSKGKEILKDLIDGKMIKTILNKYKIESADKLYDFIYKYCEENNCEMVRINGKNRAFVPKEEKKKRGTEKKPKRNLEMVLEISEWVYKNGRLPKSYPDLSTAPRKIQGTEEETPEELEMRYHVFLQNLNTRLGLSYYKSAEEISDEETRKIYTIIEELKIKYSLYIKYRIWRDLSELQEWCAKNNRMPTIKEKDYTTGIKKENETEDEKETRLFNSLHIIKRDSNKKSFSDEEVEKINNIVFNLEYKYDKAFRKALHTKFFNGISDLIINKKVSFDVIKKMANEYHVNIDEMFEEFEKDNEESR